MINYEVRAVAFIDVLGFKNLVEQSVSDLSKRKVLEELVDTLAMGVKYLNKGSKVVLPPDLIPRYTYISDCIILSAPLTDSKCKYYCGLAAVVVRSIQLTHRFLQKGFLIRGGISVGQLWHTDNNVVGPAYQEAYMAEQSAKYPRIVLSEAAAKKWVSGFGKETRLCIECQSIPMVNGVMDYYVDHQAFSTIEDAYAAYASIIKSKLVEGMGSKDRKKWVWFESYLVTEMGEASRKWRVLDRYVKRINSISRVKLWLRKLFRQCIG